MADDIVTRLREQAQAPALAWLNEAADHIQQLRDAGDGIVQSHMTALILLGISVEDRNQAVIEWQDARFGR